MSRVLVLLALAFACIVPARAQVTKQDDTLQQQIVADSFKITGSAIAQQINWGWETIVSYSIVNNSGMNLYLGILVGSAAIGSCTDVQRASGALMLVPSPHAIAYSQAQGQGPLRGAFVPSGGRASGALVFRGCSAPNPGFPTAPFSISLMVGSTDNYKAMFQFPLEADVSIRQLQPN